MPDDAGSILQGLIRAIRGGFGRSFTTLAMRAARGDTEVAHGGAGSDVLGPVQGFDAA
jgi:hypothetical protein